MAFKLHTKESLDLFNTIERVRLAAANNQFTIALCGDLAYLCALIPQLQSEVNYWRNKHSELFMEVNPIITDCPPADTGYACDYYQNKRDAPCGICPLKPHQNETD
jgi:hypothetical protein